MKDYTQMPNDGLMVNGPNGIIIHSMAEYVQGTYAPDYLWNIDLSAHYFIEPNGNVIKGPAPNIRCRHAGRSEWGGQKWLNTSYVGIEVLVEGDHDYASYIEAIKDPASFKAIQYIKLARLVQDLAALYPIVPSNIVRHSDVSPGRKVDPGTGFDWQKFNIMIFNEKA